MKQSKKKQQDTPADPDGKENGEEVEDDDVESIDNAESKSGGEKEGDTPAILADSDEISKLQLQIKALRGVNRQHSKQLKHCKERK